MTISQPDPAITRKAEVQRTNGHHRFEDEEENMEVGEEEEESMSAEAMKELYNKSVSVAPLPVSAPVSTPCQTSKKSATGGPVSCEEALLASQDQRVVSNQGVASKAYQPKPPPRVVFRPRALDVAQLKQVGYRYKSNPARLID